MFDRAKKVLNAAKEKAQETVSSYDPIRVIQLKRELRKTQERADMFQGQAGIYFKEVTILNRAVQKKSTAIKGLRAKVARMQASGLEDPESVAKHKALVNAGIIPPDHSAVVKAVKSAVKS